MSYLVYCIVDGDCQEPRRKPRCLGYPSASIVVRAAGLGAVASKAPAADLAPDVARLLAYSKIIEWYHRERTVIPMRYGCIFDGLSDIRSHLENRRREYLQLLAELDGRVEMSARVGLEEPQFPIRLQTGAVAQVRVRFAGSGAGPGTAYLANRSGYYALKKEFDKRRDEVRESICQSAEGTFARWTSEYGAQRGKGVLAVHFLVPRNGIGKFIEALKPLSVRVNGSLAVTGPWPPYNFVRSPTARPAN